MMEAKAFLERGRRLDAEINTALAAIAVMRAAAEKMTGSLSPCGGIGGEGNDRRLEDAVIKIRLAEQEVDEDVDRLIDVKNETEAMIHLLRKPLHRAILTMRYISFMPWQDIADTLNYSPSYIFSVHEDALREMEALLTAEKTVVNSSPQ